MDLHCFQLLLDAIIAFLRVFVVEEFATIGPRHVASFSVEKKQLTRLDITPSGKPMIDFCVLGSQPQQLESPLNLSNKLLLALSGIFSIFTASLLVEESSSEDKEWTEIFGMLNKVSFLVIIASSRIMVFIGQKKRSVLLL